MWERIKQWGATFGRWLNRRAEGARGFSDEAAYHWRRQRISILVLAVLIAIVVVVAKHPPVTTIAHGEIGLRTNQLTGTTTELREGSNWLVPGLQTLRHVDLADQTYRPGQGSNAYQSAEGLTFGVDVAVRYSVDPAKILSVINRLPENLSQEVVAPEVDGVVYKIFARYTMREIYSSKRDEIQDTLIAQLKNHFADDGLILHSVQIGRVELPSNYRQGLEQLLAEELASEKMRFTLELKEKQVKQTELEGEAAKVSREKAAEAQAREQIIAAQAQEESMKHVLPFKQKQIEQRELEAEAEKQARVRAAEGAAQARVIETAAEADSRRKLADAEVYRMEQVGRANSQQLERDGELVTRHPLLIQKTLADKLSDKITVIIASPPQSGGFIGSNLLGDAATGAQK